MDDLEERLRKVECSRYVQPDEVTTCWHRNPDGPEAADRIRTYREALERIAEVDMGGGFLGAKACREIARQALKG